MFETRKRSFAKAVAWRIIAATITLITAYWFTGSFGEATTITGVAALCSTIAYYIHERIWDKVAWGRRKR